MPETFTLVTEAEALKKQVEKEKKLGVVKYRAEFHVCTHALGTMKKPFTTMWLEELRSSKDLPVYNERFQEEWEDVNSKTSLSIPAWLSEKIRDGTVTEMDYACIRMGEGNKKYAKIGEAPWAKYVREPISGPLKTQSRGKELAFHLKTHVIRVNFALEGQVISVGTKVLAEMTQVSYPGNGSVRAGAALAEKEQIKRKNILMRSYRIPTRFNVPESQNSDVERSIQIMLALVPLDSSGDVHPTAQAILICDHNRLSKFTIIDLHDHSEQEHFHPGSKHWPLIWGVSKRAGEESIPYGPDFISEWADFEQGVREWRRQVLTQKVLKGPKFIAAVLSEDNAVFNGLGMHMANDLLHRACVHPFMPTVELCGDDGMFERLISELKSWSLQYQPSSSAIQRMSGYNKDRNPFEYKRSAQVVYEGLVEVYRKSHAKMKTVDWVRLTKEGYFDPKHTIGCSYDASSVQISAKEMKPASKILDVFQLEFKQGARYYTTIQARPPSHWNVMEMQIIPYMDLPDSAPNWSDFRMNTSKTTIGIASYHLNSANYNSIENVSGRKGRRKKTVNSITGGRSYNRELVSTLRGIEARTKNPGATSLGKRKRDDSE